MRPVFPLFQSHLDLSHSYWKQLLRENDLVIDATCGNGQDTLILAKLLKNGTLYAMDILSQAIENTKKNLITHLTDNIKINIHYFNQCHSSFPEDIQLNSVKLIVYNLGYLPGFGNKELTTMVETTLSSIKKALLLLKNGGVISIALYPGHPEGLKEQKAIIDFAKNLDPLEYNVCYHHWINRNKSPCLLIIQKKD